MQESLEEWPLEAEEEEEGQDILAHERKEGQPEKKKPAAELLGGLRAEQSRKGFF